MAGRIITAFAKRSVSVTPKVFSLLTISFVVIQAGSDHHSNFFMMLHTRGVRYDSEKSGTHVGFRMHRKRIARPARPYFPHQRQDTMQNTPSEVSIGTDLTMAAAKKGGVVSRKSGELVSREEVRAFKIPVRAFPLLLTIANCT